MPKGLKHGHIIREHIPGLSNQETWVLVLLPSKESKLLAQWQGPYEVIQQTDSVTY